LILFAIIFDAINAPSVHTITIAANINSDEINLPSAVVG